MSRWTEAAARARRRLAALPACAAGNIVVEFALLIAPVLMIVFGFFEFGRYFFISDSLMNAAREGARLAIVRGAASADPARPEDIVAFVKAQAPTMIDGNQIEVIVTYDPNNSPGSKVFVQVNYDYVFFVPGMSAIAPLQVSKVASMTISH